MSGDSCVVCGIDVVSAFSNSVCKGNPGLCLEHTRFVFIQHHLGSENLLLQKTYVKEVVFGSQSSLRVPRQRGAVCEECWCRVGTPSAWCVKMADKTLGIVLKALLEDKGDQKPGGGGGAAGGAGAGERAVDGRLVCRRWKATNTCGFGANCRFAHVRPDGTIVRLGERDAGVVQAMGGIVHVAQPADDDVITGIAVRPAKKTMVEEVQEKLVKADGSLRAIDCAGLRGNPRAVAIKLIDRAYLAALLLMADEEANLLWRAGALPTGCYEASQKLLRYLHQDTQGPNGRLGSSGALRIITELVAYLEKMGLKPVDVPVEPAEEAAGVEVKDTEDNQAKLLAGLAEVLKTSNDQLMGTVSKRIAQVEEKLTAGAATTVPQPGVGGDGLTGMFGGLGRQSFMPEQGFNVNAAAAFVSGPGMAPGNPFLGRRSKAASVASSSGERMSQGSDGPSGVSMSGVTTPGAVEPPMKRRGDHTVREETLSEREAQLKSAEAELMRQKQMAEALLEQEKAKMREQELCLSQEAQWRAREEQKMREYMLAEAKAVAAGQLPRGPNESMTEAAQRFAAACPVGETPEEAAVRCRLAQERLNELERQCRAGQAATSAMREEQAGMQERDAQEDMQRAHQASLRAEARARQERLEADRVATERATHEMLRQAEQARMQQELKAKLESEQKRREFEEAALMLIRRSYANRRQRLKHNVEQRQRVQRRRHRLRVGSLLVVVDLELMLGWRNVRRLRRRLSC